VERKNRKLLAPVQKGGKPYRLSFRSQMKIIVLLGGESAERRVSLASGEAVAGALAARGHEVYKVDPLDPVRLVPARVPLFNEAVGEKPPDLSQLPRFTPRRLAALLETLDHHRPDLVFPMLHGGMGEDGRLQAALEMVNIPFVGSGSLASALAMRKPYAKKLFLLAGVLTPATLLLPPSDDAVLANEKIRSSLGYPVVAKPDASGSAVGLTILKDESGLEQALKRITSLRYNVLVEPYISGRELTVTILGSEALPPIEIQPHEGVYDYLSKYTRGHTEYLCPAPLPEETLNQLKSLGLKAHQALGCRHYSRVDFRMRDDGELFCLEVNTIPGMTATSLVPKAAAAVGISFEELAERLAKMAMLDAAVAGEDCRAAYNGATSA
jgi:D-alanine-D-alanine ligase